MCPRHYFSKTVVACSPDDLFCFPVAPSATPAPSAAARAAAAAAVAAAAAAAAVAVAVSVAASPAAAVFVYPSLVFLHSFSLFFVRAWLSPRWPASPSYTDCTSSGRRRSSTPCTALAYTLAMGRSPSWGSS